MPARSALQRIPEYLKTGTGADPLIRISKSKNRRYEALLLIHELTEMLLCIDRGVSLKAIDRFDMTFKGAGEPGDDPKAPYHREHRFATRIERLLAGELRVNWAKYEAGL